MSVQAVCFINSRTGEELAAVSVEGASVEELREVKGLIAYNLGLTENDITLLVKKRARGGRLLCSNQ